MTKRLLCTTLGEESSGTQKLSELSPSEAMGHRASKDSNQARDRTLRCSLMYPDRSKAIEKAASQDINRAVAYLKEAEVEI